VGKVECSNRINLVMNNQLLLNQKELSPNLFIKEMIRKTRLERLARGALMSLGLLSLIANFMARV